MEVCNLVSNLIFIFFIKKAEYLLNHCYPYYDQKDKKRPRVRFKFCMAVP